MNVECLLQIYFYCWVEICPNSAACTQQCTIVCESATTGSRVVALTELNACPFPLAASEADRKKREAAPDSDSVELASLGPLLLGRVPEPEDTPCLKLHASKSKMWHSVPI